MTPLIWFVSAVAAAASAALLLPARATAGEAQVPAMFVLGDSLVDPGNNNRLLTLARADFYPNGVDFQEGATGRFCNGDTVADYIGTLLGLPLIPGFDGPSAEESDILQGVNYASAGSGILTDTGEVFGKVITNQQQIENFETTTLKELCSRLGEGIGDYLARSLFFFVTGSNDYINNYLEPSSDRSDTYTPDAFAQLLAQEFCKQLQSLYELGARKFLISGVGPLGCIPNQIGHADGDPDSCVDEINQLAVQFNDNVRAMLRDLSGDLPGSCFLFWDVYATTMDVINNFSQYGFKYPLTACCGLGKAQGQTTCLPLLPLQCQNRSEYVFWDAYHPTDAFNAIAANQAYQGCLQPTTPRNVKELVQL